MTGVTSNDSKASRAPLGFKGVRPGPEAAGTAFSVVKEGAIMGERNIFLSREFRMLKLSGGHRNEGERCLFYTLIFIAFSGIFILISDIGYSVLDTVDRNPALADTHMSHIRFSSPRT